MTRLSEAWTTLDRERRIAAVAAVALLVTMFLPWYGLQSLNRKTGVINSHDINAFGDVSFVEAAIFLVAVGVLALLLARAEGRNFNMPGGDGTIIALAGGWASLLIFYRVFDRPGGNGYPVGIQWGFFLAFVASGSLAYAGWRMRSSERPEMPVRRRDRTPAGDSEDFGEPPADRHPVTEETSLVPVGGAPRAQERPAPARRDPAGPDAAAERSQHARRRPRFPPAPGDPAQEEHGEQLSFEDPPAADR